MESSLSKSEFHDGPMWASAPTVIGWETTCCGLHFGELRSSFFQQGLPFVGQLFV